MPRITLQQTITNVGQRGPITDQFITEKIQSKKHNTNKDNNQTTLEETWKIPIKNMKETIKRKKLHGNSTQTTFKRMRRKRNDECMECKEGG